MVSVPNPKMQNTNFSVDNLLIFLDIDTHSFNDHFSGKADSHQ